MSVEKTPLEQLVEMNARVGKTRKRSARPRDPTAKVEKFYRAQLKSLVRAITKEVNEELVPVVKQEKSQYQVDRDYTADSWSDRILALLSSIDERFIGAGSIFNQQYERLAQRTVSMAEAETTQAFVDSVNKAVGVDLNPVLDQEGMRDYLDVAIKDNVELIKSVGREHFERIERAVLGGVRNGDAPSTIARNIQEATGVSSRRAALIARDQSAKLTSEITERRQTQSGIKYYRAVTSNDSRVTGKPGGKYPNAKISCWGIARQDVGYGPGIYRWDKGASWGGKTGLHPGRHHINCRCTASPIFEWEIKGNKK